MIWRTKYGFQAKLAERSKHFARSKHGGARGAFRAAQAWEQEQRNGKPARQRRSPQQIHEDVIRAAEKVLREVQGTA